MIDAIVLPSYSNELSVNILELVQNTPASETAFEHPSPVPNDFGVRVADQCSVWACAVVGRSVRASRARTAASAKSLLEPDTPPRAAGRVWNRRTKWELRLDMRHLMGCARNERRGRPSPVGGARDRHVRSKRKCPVRAEAGGVGG